MSYPYTHLKTDLAISIPTTLIVFMWCSPKVERSQPKDETDCGVGASITSLHLSISFNTHDCLIVTIGTVCENQDTSVMTGSLIWATTPSCVGQENYIWNVGCL